jgi:hypothetical protein
MNSGPTASAIEAANRGKVLVVTRRPEFQVDTLHGAVDPDLWH